MRAWKGWPLLLLGLAALACSTPETAPPRESETVRTGRLIFLSQPCPTCHGRDRRGTNIGPPIRDLRNRWTDGRLANFLRDPASFRHADPRLREISERYRTDMPGPILGDETKVRALIAYLLAE